MTARLLALASLCRLAKSKNVRLHTRGLSETDRDRRMTRYAQTLGFEPRPGSRDEFGVGRGQRGVTYTDEPGAGLAHELGHALQTDRGQKLADRQRSLGLTDDRFYNSATMAQGRLSQDETRALDMEPLLRRRAGIRLDDDPGMWRQAAGDRSPGDHAAMRELVGRWDAGRRAIAPGGTVVSPRTVDARINRRAAGAAGLPRKPPTPSVPAKLPGGGQ